MSDPAPNPIAKHPTEVLFVLLLAGVSFALSQTLVIPALPAISRDLDASATSTSWILTGFLLSASVATPIVGKLGDLFGRGRVLTAVLIVFSLGGVVCALAGSIGVLIAGRVIQGVAGGVFPLAFGIVRDTFPPERVATGLGIVSAIFGIGGGIGLPLSGVMVDNLDVEWLFWISLIALPAAIAAYRLIPRTAPVERTRIDWLGAGILSASLAAILLGVTEANTWSWGSLRTLGLIAAGLALLGLWTRVEATRSEPLIDLRVLAERAVATTNLTGFLVGFSMFASFLLIPQFAQAPESTGYGFGFSVTQSGLLLMPAAVTQLVAGPLAGRLGTHIGFRTTLAIGAGLSSASFTVLAFEHARPWEFVVAACLLGAGISFAFASMANLIVGAVPQADVGIATGINTVMRTVGGAFGAAVATAILTAHTLGGTPAPTEGAYTAAFLLSSATGLLSIGAALLVPTRAAERARRIAEAATVSSQG
jgi:EmrB/QacA subfamily drug resistance transporter